MSWKREWLPLALLVAGFLACFFLPVGSARFDNAVGEALHLVKWYAREHVLLCLVPAFFIAGAIGVFVRQAAVIRYLGAQAHRVVAYGVASVSGCILAVCSCTVLPLFAGIYRRGAGLGPAVAFLYSGPAINVLAIVLTARVLGVELGAARAVGAIGFSVVIGVVMHLLFRGEEREKADAQASAPDVGPSRPLWQTALLLAAMVGVLVFANWGAPGEVHVRTVDGQALTVAVLGTVEDGGGEETVLHLKITEGPRAGEAVEIRESEIAARVPVGGWATAVWRVRWPVAALCAAALGAMLVAWLGLAWWKVLAAAMPAVALAVVFPGVPMLAFAAGVLGLSVMTSTGTGEASEWFASSWGFAKQILPLLLAGVLVAGALLGRPGHEGLIPPAWVAAAVGGNSLAANLFAAVAGAFMYFATLTEVPIVQGLIDSGMGKGPALALLLAGPALSLPNMLVIRSVLGTKKTLTYLALVVVMATASGFGYGLFAG